VSREKLYDYALNPEHPIGRHKARVFRSVLGIERSHADVLAEVIKQSLERAYAERREVTQYGELWVTHHAIVGLNGNSAIVTVGWVIDPRNPEQPRLVTCYIDLENQESLERLLRLGT